LKQVSNVRTGAVTVVDDDEDLREALLSLLSYLVHAPGLALSGLSQMIEHQDAVLRCRLVILDINLGAGKPSGLDAFHWLKRQAFAGRIVFLTGHARSQPLVQQACALGEARVYEKPIGIAELRKMVEEAS
jgi:FixJ family two-component response regulator